MEVGHSPFNKEFPFNNNNNGTKKNIKIDEQNTCLKFE